MIVKGKFYKAKRIVFGWDIEGFQEKMQYTKQTNKQTNKQNKTKQNEVGRFFFIVFKRRRKTEGPLVFERFWRGTIAESQAIAV